MIRYSAPGQNFLRSLLARSCEGGLARENSRAGEERWSARSRRTFADASQLCAFAVVPICRIGWRLCSRASHGNRPGIRLIAIRRGRATGGHTRAEDAVELKGARYEMSSACGRSRNVKSWHLGAGALRDPVALSEKACCRDDFGARVGHDRLCQFSIRNSNELISNVD